MRIENESQQHFVEKAVIRSEIFREKNNNIMFPYKPPRGVNDDVGNHMTNRGQSYHSNQRHHEYKDNRVVGVDPAAFDKLVRRVDWLYEEVRYVRQSLDSIRRHTTHYEHRSVAQQPSYRSYPEAWERPRHNFKVEIPPPPPPAPYYERVHNENSCGRSVPHDYPVSSSSSRSVISPNSRHQPCPIPVSSIAEDRTHPVYSSKAIQQQQQQASMKQDKEIPQYDLMDSPLSNSHQQSYKSSVGVFSIPEDLTIGEIVVLWERGINNLPPVVEWDVEEKSQHRDRLAVFFKVYYIFRNICNADIAHFIAQYTDNTTKQVESPARVASFCPDVHDSFESFMKQLSKLPADASQEKIYTLPRKINGRKVSARDVIQLWEYGMGEVPPIKTWTKSQKFKQQSKISRWKKIVDIFKYQCNSDMRKFEEIYADGHGCLLPVAAITNRFETLYGDELNITSKLMTVPTSEEQSLTVSVTTKDTYSARKRKLTDESGSDEGEEFHSRNVLHLNRTEDIALAFAEDIDVLGKSKHHHFHNNTLTPPPPLLVSLGSPPKLIKSEEDISRSPPTEDRMNGHSLLVVKTTASHTNNTPSHFGNEHSPQSSNTESEDVYEDVPSSDGQGQQPHIRRLSSIIYVLPDSMTIKEAITFWEKGSNDFPPVRTWTRPQNSIQTDLIMKLERLYSVYTERFHNDIDALLACSLDEENHEISIEQFIGKYQDVKFSQTPTSTNASSMTFDFSHHKTISQSTDALYLLPRKINGRKVSAKDVLQLWYHGLNKIPPVKLWSPQQKAVQQSKISRWKKIVELFEQEFNGDWDKFHKHFSNNLGQLLPITAIITKHEEETRSMTEGVLLQNQ